MTDTLSTNEREYLDTLILDYITRYGIKNKKIKNLVRTLGEQLYSINGDVLKTEKQNNTQQPNNTVTSFSYSTPRVAPNSTSNTSIYQELVNNNTQNDTDNSTIQNPTNVNDKQQVFYERLLNTLEKVQSGINSFKEQKDEKGVIRLGAEKIIEKQKDQKETEQPSRIAKAAELYLKTADKLSGKFSDLNQRLESFREQRRQYGVVGIAARHFYNRYKKPDTQANLPITQTDNIVSADTQASNIITTPESASEQVTVKVKQSKQNNNDSQKKVLSTDTEENKDNIQQQLLLPNIQEQQEQQKTYFDDTLTTLENTEESTILLTGFTTDAQTELENVFSKALAPIFGTQQDNKIDTIIKILTNISSGEGSGQNDDGGWFGRNKGSKGILSKVGQGLANFGRGAVTLAKTPVAAAATGKAGLAGVLGTAGAVVGGEVIGGQIGKAIGSNEAVSEYLYGSKTAGKEAYEKYGTGITGFLGASYDYVFGEGAELRKSQKESEVAIKAQEEELNARTTLLKEHYESKGYKSPEEFKKAVQAGETNPIKWNKQTKKFDVLEKKTQQTNKQQAPSEPSNVELQTAKPVEEKVKDLDLNVQSLTQIQSYGSRANKLLENEDTEGLQKLRDELKQSLKIENSEDYNRIIDSYKDNPYTEGIHLLKEQPPVKWNPETKKLEPIIASSLPKEVAPNILTDSIKSSISNQETTPSSTFESTPFSLTPTNTTTSKIEPEKDFSSTINNITNSNIDNTALHDIAVNTQTTNEKIQNLSQAVYKLAQVFSENSNKNPQSSPTVINPPTPSPSFSSASLAASNNDDPIRRVRNMFLFS